MSQTKAQLVDPVDGSLVNADINASAAIAGTKISPDFGSQTLITDGISLVGLSSQLSSNAAKLQVAHTDGNADIIVHRAGNNANPPSFNFQKTRNASIGNYGTIVQDDDELGSLRWGGADGSNIAFAARIVGAVDGTPGTNDMPGRIQFHTSPDGGEDLTERMRIDASGRVGIAQTPVSEKLEVSGAIRSTGASANFAAGSEAVFMDFIPGNRGRIGTITGTGSARDLAFNIGNLEKMRINTSGNLGLGTTNPTSKIDIHCGTDNTGLQITSTDAGAFASYFDNTGASTIGHQGTALTLSCDPAGSVGSSAIVFQIDSNSEKMRIDSAGRLLIGINTARANFGNNTSGVEQQIQLEGTTATKSTMSLIRNSNDANDGGIILGKTRGTSVGSNTVVQAGDDLGALNFVGADGTSLQFGAAISATVESGVGNDDMPASLKFFTNGGSTSMAERVRITSGGFLYVNKTSSSDFGRFEVKGGTADDIETSDIRTETVATFSGSSPGTTASGKGVGIVIKPIADRGCNFFIGTANSSSNQEAHGSLIFRSGNFASATSERLRIDQNGHLLPGADNSLNLGSATKRWANLYTTDLKLSNEGSQNDVDSTWGNYTIQEGYEDLFLINHRTGKKFKFNLTEVA